MKKMTVKILCRLVILLVFFIVSCSGLEVKTETGERPSRATMMPAEPVDAACAYFYFLWGKSAELDHRYEEALEAYEKVLLCDEHNEKVMGDLAILLLKMDRREDAAHWFEKLVARNPDDLGSRLMQAKLFASLGRVGEAIAAYQLILEKKEDEQILLQLAALYASEQRNHEALKVLKRVVRLDDTSYMGHYSLARLYGELGDFSKAERAYEKALAINWSIQLAYETAEFFERHDHVEQAIALYGTILEEDETEHLARTRRVNAYLGIDENDKALNELKVLKELIPGHKGVDLTIGGILLTHKKYDEAIAVFAARLAEDPPDEQEEATLRFFLAQAYLRRGDLTVAKELLAMLPPTAKEYEDAVLTRVRIMHEQEDLAGAMALLEERIRLPATRRYSFYVALATMYRQDKRNEVGRRLLQQAVREYPDNPELLFEYGMFLERLGDQAAALEVMEQLLVLEPDNSSALNYVGYTWADNNIHLEKALEFIQRAISLKPDDGYILDSLGWAYFRLGEIARAVEELEKAVAVVADDPVIHEHLGDVYRHLSRRTDAIKAYQKALENYQDDVKKQAVHEKIKALKSRIREENK